MEHDTSNYRLETPHGCVAHLCALCLHPIALEAGAYTAAQIDQRIADHHAVCPRRPLAIGDEVEWSRVGRDLRIIGRLVEMAADKSHVYIEVREQHGKWPYEMVGNRQRCDGPVYKSVAIRRIPRPAAALVNTEDMPLHSDAVNFRGSDACAPGCRCGAHAISPRKLSVEGQATYDRLHEEYRSPPAPALMDGIDREVCLARWMENRLAVESRCAAPNAMTRMQRDVAREMWLQRYGVARSAELRGMVDADREAERNRVRVEVQDVE